MILHLTFLKQSLSLNPALDKPVRKPQGPFVCLPGAGILHSQLLGFLYRCLQGLYTHNCLAFYVGAKVQNSSLHACGALMNGPSPQSILWLFVTVAQEGRTGTSCPGLALPGSTYHAYLALHFNFRDLTKAGRFHLTYALGRRLGLLGTAWCGRWEVWRNLWYSLW